MERMCFYSRKKKTVIDVISSDGLGIYGKQNLEQTQAEDETVILVSTDEAMDLIADAQKTPEITEADWHEMLEVLPPENWHQLKAINYFQMSEHWVLNCITSTYARYKGGFYSFRDNVNLSPDYVIAKLDEYLNNQKAVAI